MSNTEIKRAMWPILNGKGGVSKTFTASMIAEWLQFCNLPFRLLDCDDNASLTKRICEAERQTVKSSNDMEALMMRILESPITLADCPSNITAEVISLFSGADFGPALQSVQGQLIVIVPITSNDLDCFDEARRIVMAIKNTAKYLVAKNERDGTDFSAFSNSTTGMFLQACGSRELVLPKLNIQLQRLCNADRLTLSQFLGRFYFLQETNPVAAFSQTSTAQSAANFLRNVFSQMNDLASFILPPELVIGIQPVTAGAVKEFACRSWATKNAYNNNQNDNRPKIKAL